MIPRYSRAGLIVALVVWTAAAAQAKSAVEGRWRSTPIEIDGDLSDWHFTFDTIEGQEVAIGVLNDRESLYVGLRTGNQELMRQAATRGLELRLEPKGRKALALQYPMGAAAAGIQRPAPGERLDREQLRRQLEGSLDAFLLLEPIKEVRPVAANDFFGIEVRAAFERNVLVYELKVPLRAGEGTPYAAEAVPGKPLKLIIRTPEPEIREMTEGRDRPDDEFGSSGGLGREDSRYGSGGYGAGAAGSHSRFPDSIRIKTRIELAEPPQAAQEPKPEEQARE